MILARGSVVWCKVGRCALGPMPFAEEGVGGKQSAPRHGCEASGGALGDASKKRAGSLLGAIVSSKFG